MLRKLLITMTAFLIVVSGALCNGKSVSANEQRKPGKRFRRRLPW